MPLSKPMTCCAIFSAALLVSCSTADSPSNDTAIEEQRADMKPKTDLSYGPHERNTLDLYVPADVTDPPLLVFIHGGQWRRDDKDRLDRFGRIDALMKAGIAVATINMRYSTDAIWPAQLEDIRAAARFLREHAVEYGYTTDQIAYWGESSGAHLALMAGLSGAPEFGLSEGGPIAPTAAIVAWFAPSDLTQIAADREADNVPGGNEEFGQPTPENRLIGGPVADNLAKARAASPVDIVQTAPPNAPIPPILLAHGTQDPVVSPLQSDRLKKVVEARFSDAEITLRKVDGASHGSDEFADEIEPAIAFLLRHLKAGG